MAKYTLDTYGWSFEAICKTLTDEQVQLVKDKMEEEGFTELHEIRFDLDELLDLDFWDGEVFHQGAAKYFHKRRTCYFCRHQRRFQR